MDPDVSDDDAPPCERCGRPVEPASRDSGMCGDCYWDYQTDADGSLD